MLSLKKKNSQCPFICYVFLNLEGWHLCSGRYLVTVFNSFITQSSTFQICVLLVSFPLFYTMYSLSLYRSCAGFFLIVTHLGLQWVLPDQLFIGGFIGKPRALSCSHNSSQDQGGHERCLPSPTGVCGAFTVVPTGASYPVALSLLSCQVSSEMLLTDL